MVAKEYIYLIKLNISTFTWCSICRKGDNRTVNFGGGGGGLEGLEYPLARQGAKR